MKENETNQPQEVNVKSAQAADVPSPRLTPQQVVDMLRAMRAQMPDVAPLTDQERAIARAQARIGGSHEAVLASVNVVGASAVIEQGVGMPAEQVLGMIEDRNRWTAVEDELKGLLSGVSDANLIRRQRTSIVAAKAYGIAKELARDNPEVRPHVKEIKRLRALSRRKKPAAEPQPAPAPAPGTPTPKTQQ